MQKKLTQRQKAALKRHASHQYIYMEQMKKDMKSGKTFTEAHTNAMRKVGK